MDCRADGCSIYQFTGSLVGREASLFLKYVPIPCSQGFDHIHFDPTDKYALLSKLITNAKLFRKLRFKGSPAMTLILKDNGVSHLLRKRLISAVGQTYLAGTPVPWFSKIWTPVVAEMTNPS